MRLWRNDEPPVKGCAARRARALQGAGSPGRGATKPFVVQWYAGVWSVLFAVEQRVERGEKQVMVGSR